MRLCTCILCFVCISSFVFACDDENKGQSDLLDQASDGLIDQPNDVPELVQDLGELAGDLELSDADVQEEASDPDLSADTDTQEEDFVATPGDPRQCC